MTPKRLMFARIAAAGILAVLPATLFGQGDTTPPPVAAAQAPRPPQFVSPEVMPDRRVAFRVYAPKAEAVRLAANDVAGMTPTSGQMTKGDNGVWEIVTGAIDPGAYRYNFNIDGVATIDPRNPSTSESNNNTWSLVCVPGSEFMDTRRVPHGAVSAVTYYSTALERFRRIHVYTPPGYETSTEKYPVFYLLHGAGDSDDSWTSVGRAGIILDNLIADKKAKPMIVVMPAGHTSAGGFRVPGSGDEFSRDFVNDIMPYAEKHYRIHADRAHRAIAGLSMGGNQTLAVAIPHLNEFAYIGVYSSGLLGSFRSNRPGAAPTPAPPPGPGWEEQNMAALDNAAWKKGLKLFWFATGKEDRLLETTQKTVELFQKHGFQPVMKESPGGHTWINWRNYLDEFAPLLFQ